MPENIGRLIGVFFVAPIVILLSIFNIRKSREEECCSNFQLHTELKSNGVSVTYCLGCGVIHNSYIYKKEEE